MLFRSNVFLRNAGTTILAISVAMWWLSAFPRVDGDARMQQAQSFAGRIGEAVQPAFAPLGFDSQLTVGVMTSFMAREVFASTMGVLAGAGTDAVSADIGVVNRGAEKGDDLAVSEYRTQDRDIEKLSGGLVGVVGDQDVAGSESLGGILLKNRRGQIGRAHV